MLFDEFILQDLNNLAQIRLKPQMRFLYERYGLHFNIFRASEQEI